MAKPTIEEDWKRLFPFLIREGEEAPFLLALCHAKSARHLERMLREWLPPEWRLSNDELAMMQAHWNQWYRPQRKTGSGGTSDELARNAMSRMVWRSEGLGNHYLQKIAQAFENGSGFWPDLERSPQAYIANRSERVFDSGLLAGARCWVSAFFQYDVELKIRMRVCIGIDKHILTEALTHTVLHMSPPSFTSGVQRGFSVPGIWLVYEIETSPIANIIDLATILPNSGVTDVPSRSAKRLKAEVLRQLHERKIPIALTE